MEKQDSFIKKNIYSINIVLAFVLVFSIGFLVGGQRTMMHTKKTMMLNGMSSGYHQTMKSHKSCKCTDCAMRKQTTTCSSCGMSNKSCSCPSATNTPATKSSCKSKQPQIRVHTSRAPNVVVRNLNADEAKEEMEKMQKEMQQIQNNIMQQHKEIFNR